MVEFVTFFLFLFAMGTVVMLFQYMEKRNERLSNKAADLEQITARLEKIEKRLENVETIVIERRKKEEFERL